MFSERSGVINIALEGLMLAGAFTAAVATYELGNPYLGLLVRNAGGRGAGFDLRDCAASNLKPTKLSAGIGDQFFDARIARALSAARFTIPPVRPSKSPKTIFCREFFNRISIASLLAFVLVPLCWYVLYKTPFGLRLRAVGENPAAADAAGVSVIQSALYRRYFVRHFGGGGRRVSFDRAILAVHARNDRRDADLSRSRR